MTEVFIENLLVRIHCRRLDGESNTPPAFLIDQVEDEVCPPLDATGVRTLCSPHPTLEGCRVWGNVHSTPHTRHLQSGGIKSGGS